MTLRRTMVSVLAFGLVGMLLPTDASAAFKLHVIASNGGVILSSVVITDDDAVNDILTGVPGEILYNLFIPDTDNPIQATVALAYSQGSFGVIDNQMRLASFELRSTGPVTLELTLEDTGFDIGAPGHFTLANDISGTLCGGGGYPTECDAESIVMLSATSYANPNNYSLFGDLADPMTMIPVSTTSTGTLMFPGSMMAGPTSLADLGDTFAETDFEATGDFFSMYTRIVVSFSATGGDADVVQFTTATPIDFARVPEPASLLLIATGFLGLACAKRRRFPLLG